MPVRAWVGLGLSIGLGSLSLLAGRVFPEAAREHLPARQWTPRAPTAPCASWPSAASGSRSPSGWPPGRCPPRMGLLVAAVARLSGGTVERWVMRPADAFFALPDVLVVMVLQLAGQSLVDAGAGAGLGPFGLMVVSLALVGWAGPARMFRNRLATLEGQEFVAASRALGGHAARTCCASTCGPRCAPSSLAVFLSRLPAAILAESTVSFFGIARMEPMSLGRYLGTSYAALIYEGGARVVLPAWLLLVLLVLGASLASQALARRAAPRAFGAGPPEPRFSKLPGRNSPRARVAFPQRTHFLCPRRARHVPPDR